MIEILDGYVLPPLTFLVDIQRLLDRKTQMIPMLETPPHKRKAARVMAEAKERGDFSTLSYASRSS
jgi:hypothetical protein